MSEMTLLDLADRVDNLERGDNRLDVLIEIAMFDPDDLAAAVRSNAAGTKVIYTDHRGNHQTSWAWDWTGADRRSETVRLLRARHALTLSKGSDV